MHFSERPRANGLSFINSNFTQYIVADFFCTLWNLYAVFGSHIWKRGNLIFGVEVFRVIFDRRRVIKRRWGSVHKIRIINLLGEVKIIMGQ